MLCTQWYCTFLTRYLMVSLRTEDHQGSPSRPCPCASDPACDAGPGPTCAPLPPPCLPVLHAFISPSSLPILSATHNCPYYCDFPGRRWWQLFFLMHTLAPASCWLISTLQSPLRHFPGCRWQLFFLTHTSPSSLPAHQQLTPAPLPLAWLQLLFKRAQVDQEGVDYMEFLAATLHLGRLERDERLWRAFRHFDSDGRGYISRENLLTALSHLGKRVGAATDQTRLTLVLTLHGTGPLMIQGLLKCSLWCGTLS